MSHRKSRVSSASISGGGGQVPDGSPEFSALSIKLTSLLTKTEKKNGGIYFTPPSCIQRIMELLRSCGDRPVPFMNILEPSCGSGEFISALITEYPQANITGIEFHPNIYNEVSQYFAKRRGDEGGSLGEESRRRVQIEHGDFLKYCQHTKAADDETYDLIIGNPPYFVMKKEEVPAEYHPFFEGRPNIFVLFIIKSAKLLRSGGVIAFVLPSSFMNSLYYDKARKYIVRHFAILHIVRWRGGPVGADAYLETQQDTIILIIRKHADTDPDTDTDTKTESMWVLEKSGATIFTDNLPRLSSLYAGSHSLHELGFKVNVGSVVWNQCKNILTNDTTKTRLIYSSNIQNRQFVDKIYKNEEKKAFICKPGIQTPMIVINRGYGVGEYQFDYCLITPEVVGGGGGYLIENHLICITCANTSTDDGTDIDIPLSVAETAAKFDNVIRSLNDPRTQEFISCYFGNNAVNTTELNHMLPIYL